MTPDRKLPTHSQRLRAVLFRVWEQSSERRQGVDAETFYQDAMEKVIASIKRRLDPPPPTE